MPVSIVEDKVWQLLFIGLDWYRKGGDTAVKTLMELKKAGYKCKLTIVGCDPKLKLQTNEIVVIPFLDKNKKEECSKLQEIYSKSHLLILPTKADCTPVVFCEAAEYGIPVITSDTGGTSSIIREGVNGYLLPRTANEKDYANKIISILEDKNRYNNYRTSSRNEFESRLSWDIWVKKVNKVLDKSYVV